MRAPSPYHSDLHGVCYVVNNEGSEGRMMVMKSFAKCALVLLGVVLFAACGGSGNSNGINNDADYELYEPETYGAEESDNDDDNDTETTSNQTLPPTTQIQTPTVTSQETNDEVPFLWLVTAPHGQTMYIFGSIHVGTADLYPLSPVIMDAFRRSDYLAVEAMDLGDSTNPAALLLTDGQTITDYIPEELHQRAIAVLMEYENYLLASAGIPVQAMDSLRPFMWWQLLRLMAAEKSNLSAEHGLDAFFMREALALGMEILSVEDADRLVEAITGMSLPLYIALIENVLDISSSAKEVAILYKLWRSGDDKDLMAQYNLMNFFDNEELAREFHEVIFTNRDIQMANRASEFMAEGKKVFFVVGAAHLLVEGNVIYLLEQRGYEIERIR